MTETWAVRIPGHRVSIRVNVLERDTDGNRVLLKLSLFKEPKWVNSDDIEWLECLDDSVSETRSEDAPAKTQPAQLSAWKPVRPADPNEIEETERRLGERHNDKETE